MSIGQTVGQFLEQRPSDVVTLAKAPKTAVSFAEIVRLHVIPALGQHQLEKLNAQQIAALLWQKTDAGLSPRRVCHIHAVLRNAFNQAVRWGIIVRNPAALVESPSQRPHEITPFPATEARALLATADGDRLAAPSAWRSRLARDRGKCSACTGAILISTRSRSASAPRCNGSMAS